MFFTQCSMCCLQAINYRAAAQGNFLVSSTTVFFSSTILFFIIRRITTSKDAWHQWFGYSTGAVVGSITGIYLSELLPHVIK